MNLSDKWSDLLKNESVNKLLEKLKSDKKIALIILVGFVGMILILFSPDDNKIEKNSNDYDRVNFNSDNIQSEVESMIESIKGAGKTKVYITYESDSEHVYAMNVDEKSDGTELHYKSEYIITDDETGLILKVIYPKVRGVAVICEGGGDPLVKEKIYSVISALFDISTNKISVTDMK
ncbi:MAG: hypothetical protein IKY78_05505 [Clostridia bacterium]|nr:hypothetical protein [Clostridia bacterium]